MSDIFDKNRQKAIFVDLTIDVIRQLFEIAKTSTNIMLQTNCSDSLRFLLNLETKILLEDNKNVKNLKMLIELLL